MSGTSCLCRGFYRTSQCYELETVDRKTHSPLAGTRAFGCCRRSISQREQRISSHGNSSRRDPGRPNTLRLNALHLSDFGKQSVFLAGQSSHELPIR
jgi:hypothetical protein